MAKQGLAMRALGALAAVMGYAPPAQQKTMVGESKIGRKKAPATKGQRHRSLKSRANRRKAKGRK